MAQTFFPDTAFAWAFCIGLFLLTCVAAWTDTRRAKIPNRLTVAILVLGVVVNAARAGWRGAENLPLSYLDTGSVWLGVLDGILFSLLGFVVVFAVMFGFWVLNACGGGDVKLLSAVAAWVGVWYFLWLWTASIVFLVVWMLARVMAGQKATQRVNLPVESDQADKDNKTDGKGAPDAKGPTKYEGKKKPQKVQVRQIRVTYSLPFAAATAVVLLWLFRFELQLQPPKTQPAQPQGASAHARPSPDRA